MLRPIVGLREPLQWDSQWEDGEEDQGVRPRAAADGSFRRGEQMGFPCLRMFRLFALGVAARWSI